MGVIATIILAVILNFLFNFVYKKTAQFIENNEVKTIDYDLFNSILQISLEPCRYFNDRPNLIFTLPSNRINLAFEKLNELRCFFNEDFLLKIVEETIKHDREDLLTTFLLPKAQKTTIGTIFYKCAFHRFYSCVDQIIQNSPMTLYEGKNILHFAAIFSDRMLLELAPTNVLYLHMRDKVDGNVPTKYVKSKHLAEDFVIRAKMESRNTPYPKELQANIDYMKKSNDVNFVSSAERIKGMFIDSSWFRVYLPIVLTVPRHKILKYSFQELNSMGFMWYSPSHRDQFFVQFVDEMGYDNSGVTNDWISSLIKIFFTVDPNRPSIRPLFLPYEDSHYYVPTEFYSESYYKFAGSIVALALKFGITTRVEFIPTIYRLILGIEPVRTDDLQLVQPDVYKNLMLLKEYFADEETIEGLDFNSMDQVDAYIHSHASLILYDRQKIYLKAFADGFRSKIPRQISKYLDLTDLRETIRGPLKISMDDLRANLRYDDESFQKNFLLSVLSDYSDEDRFKFVRFVTGRHGIPYGGLSELDKRIKVYFNVLPIGHLPTASTCFSHLHLPPVHSTSELHRILSLAINNCDTLDRQ